MEEIGQRSYPMLYRPTSPHSRHPSRCLLLGSFTPKPCQLPVDLEHRVYWAIKKLNLSLDQAGKERLLQLQELQELRNELYQNVEIYKAKNKPFMTSILIGKLFMFMTRYGFMILILNSFQGNCALGGMVHMKSFKFLTMDRS